MSLGDFNEKARQYTSVETRCGYVGDAGSEISVNMSERNDVEMNAG